jgi:AcrR family transcriptional regulator
MRRLGAEVGAGTASVYWHIRDKAQLIDLVVDEIVGQIQVPTEGSAEERLLGAAHAARKVLLSYSGAAQELARGRLTSGPNSMLMHESLMALLAETGVAVPLLWDAYLSLLTYLIGQVLPESWGSAEVDEERAKQTAEWVASLPFDQLPTIEAVAKHPRMAFEERLEFGLRAFLAGLKATVR